MAYYASSMINHPFLFLRIFPSAFPSVRFLAAACRFCISNKQSRDVRCERHRASANAIEKLSLAVKIFGLQSFVDDSATGSSSRSSRSLARDSFDSWAISARNAPREEIQSASSLTCK